MEHTNTSIYITLSECGFDEPIEPIIRLESLEQVRTSLLAINVCTIAWQLPFLLESRLEVCHTTSLDFKYDKD